MNVLMMTQRVDERHDILGFAVDWIDSLARQVNELTVLTAFEGSYDLPSNVSVVSFGKNRGNSKPRRILSFERFCAGQALSTEFDVVFVHMIPQYVLASWPWFRLDDVPFVLWYAHGTIGWDTRLATRVVDAIVTPTTNSFRLSTPKLHVVGHGIDTDRFSPGDPATDRTRLLGVGRMAPVKNIDVLVEGVAELAARGRDISFRMIAGEPTAHEDYYDRIQALVTEHGLSDRITFVESVPHEQMVAEYRQVGVFLNASQTGSLDKTEVEALATGTPVVSCNDSFVDTVHESSLEPDLTTFDAGDPVSLADTIERVLDLDETTYASLAEGGRSVAVEGHDVSALMASLTDLFQSVVER